MRLLDSSNCRRNQPKSHRMDVRESAVVLIVEDEPIVRLDAIDTLTHAGFRVIEAANADEAIAILESRDDIRVVVTDIQMPGSMDGLKLAATIGSRWPPIALIVTSGRICVEKQDLPERGRFLPKPYSGAGLVDAIHAVL
jgi:two-component system, response regulator PdtaR